MLTMEFQKNNYRLLFTEVAGDGLRRLCLNKGRRKHFLGEKTEIGFRRMFDTEGTGFGMGDTNEGIL